MAIPNTVFALLSRPGGLTDMPVCAKVVGDGLQEEGVSTIYSFIFERGWLKGKSVNVYRGGLQEGGGLQGRIRYKMVYI